jgi:hypothetical protein
MMRDLQVSEIQIDEQWAFVGKTPKHVTPDDPKETIGEMWLYVAAPPELVYTPIAVTSETGLSFPLYHPRRKFRNSASSGREPHRADVRCG